MEFIFHGPMPSYKGIHPIVRKLLEHREQRFRLNYILGELPVSSAYLKDTDDADQEDHEQEVGGRQEGLSSQERLHSITTLQSFLDTVQSLATLVREDLLAHAPVPAEAVLWEVLEQELYEHDIFQQLVDDIVDAVEERFSVLQQRGHTVFDQAGWPSYWTLECEDREEFLAIINQFSGNDASLFGRLLTPLVQGMRVLGPFRPPWREGPFPRLVLMDGEGLGHTLDTAMSLPTRVTSRFEQADAILLVDSALQPIQAAPAAVLNTLEASGHLAKLLICFTHMDGIEGGNLPTMCAIRWTMPLPPLVLRWAVSWEDAPVRP